MKVKAKGKIRPVFRQRHKNIVCLEYLSPFDEMKPTNELGK